MENSIKSVRIQIRFRSVSRCRRLVSFSLSLGFSFTLFCAMLFFLLFCILSLWLSYHKNAQANYKLDESGSDVVLVAGDVSHSPHSISSFSLHLLAFSRLNRIIRKEIFSATNPTAKDCLPNKWPSWTFWCNSKWKLSSVLLNISSINFTVSFSASILFRHMQFTLVLKPGIEMRLPPSHNAITNEMAATISTRVTQNTYSCHTLSPYSAITTLLLYIGNGLKWLEMAWYVSWTERNGTQWT